MKLRRHPGLLIISLTFRLNWIPLIHPGNLPARTDILTHNAQQLKKMLAEATEETSQDFGVAMTEAEQFFRGVFQESDQLPEPLGPRLLTCFRYANKPAARGEQTIKEKNQEME